MLQPGERVRVPVYYAGLQRPWDTSDDSVELQIRIRDAEDPATIDWESYIADERPELVPEDAWNAVMEVLVDQAGATWADYISMLNENATYLSRLGRLARNIDDLFGFEYLQANGIGVVPTLAAATDASVPSTGPSLNYGRTFGNTITERYKIGPFGRGWQAPTQPYLSVSEDGTVNVFEAQGAVRRYQPDSRYPGRYVSGPGETGVLRQLGDDTFILTEANGFQRSFLPDGKLNYRKDSNGNSITYSYLNDRLTTMTHSSGSTITIAYNSDGLVESVTDSTGWTTTYAYDTDAKLLLSASNPAGTTSYTYVTGEGAAKEFALASITDASGVTRTLEYDDLGRLAATYVGANEGRLDYIYDQPGRVTISDQGGVTTLLSFDHNGRLARTEDATGNYQLFEYDAAGNLIANDRCLRRQ